MYLDKIKDKSRHWMVESRVEFKLQLEGNFRGYH